MKNSTPSLKSKLNWFVIKCIVLSCYLLSSVAVIASPTAVTFTQHPASATVCAGNNASFSVVATGSSALSYQWQVSTDGGGSWSNTSNGVLYNGVTTANLTLTATTALNTHRYRCVVSDGSSSNSNSALLTVTAAPTVQTSNISVNVCINGSSTITAAFYSNLTYQWQLNTGSGFNNVINGGVYSGASTSNLGITAVPASMEGYVYRYIATNTTTGCTAISGSDTLHVQAYAVVTSQPVSATICPAGNTSFIVAGTGAASMKWQTSTNGVLWTDITDNALYSGATSTTLSVTNVTASMNNYRYRAILYNSLGCPFSSNIVFLFVRTPTSIVTQPSNTSVCATSNATFSVTAAGSTLTYQWQTDNGTAGTIWSTISPGGTSTTLTVSSVTMSMNGYRYRVIVSGFCGVVTSSAATLTTSEGTWLGVISTDWHTAGNWCGGVPTSTTNVLIPNTAPRMPNISAGVGYSASLTLQTGSSLTISGGTTSMAGPFSLLGTVAYIATADQLILPATHFALQIAGSGNKYLQATTDITKNLALGGTAKLVTGSYVLIMKLNSDPITGANITDATTSWIVTGNGGSGIGNAGIGGLRMEEIKTADGDVLFPIGPTPTAYNPLQLFNQGAKDEFTVKVNDQLIAGGINGFGLNCTWLITEGIRGGSNFRFNLKWIKPEEQPAFDSSRLQMVRSNGLSIVETSPVSSLASSQPFLKRNQMDFLDAEQVSLSTFIVVPVKLQSLNVQKTSNTVAKLSWTEDVRYGARSYIVQKSGNGVQFNDIAQVNGEEGKINYNFTDDKLGMGTTYYRLKMTGWDNEVDLSKILTVLNRETNHQAQLRPSVTTATSTRLFVQMEKRDQVTMTLCNATGHVQWNKTIELQKGEHTMPLDITSLSKGVYFLRISTAQNVTQVLSLIKQ